MGYYRASLGLPHIFVSPNVIWPFLGSVLLSSDCPYQKSLKWHCYFYYWITFARLRALESIYCYWGAPARNQKLESRIPVSTIQLLLAENGIRFLAIITSAKGSGSGINKEHVSGKTARGFLSKHIEFGARLPMPMGWFGFRLLFNYLLNGNSWANFPFSNSAPI